MQSKTIRFVATLIFSVLLFTAILIAGIFSIVAIVNRDVVRNEIQKADSVVKAHAGLQCPKCGGSMDRGFLIDRAHGHPGIGTWVPGEPQAGWLGELKDNNMEQVTTFRCSKCGYLESYTK